MTILIIFLFLSETTKIYMMEIYAFIDNVIE